ncbi:MAG: DUF1579 family protein [Armatimonadetes bacterium]|nr:DUF1579 family protein [Armatimonadota bacterium]
MKKVLGMMVVAAIASGAIAQDMSEFLPKKELATLDFLVGKWTGTVETNFGGGEDVKMKATMTNKWDVGNRFMTGDVVYDMGPMGVMYGKQMITFDPTEKNYVLQWFDMSEPLPMTFRGTWNDKTISMASGPTKTANMGTLTMRTSYTKVDDKSINFLLEQKNGDKWEWMMKSSFKKQ